METKYTSHRTKAKTTSAPTTPTAAISPAFPVYPSITTAAPPSPHFSVTSPRSITVENRRKMLTLDSPSNNRVYLEPITPPSRGPLSPSRMTPPPPSTPSPTRTSPTYSSSPSSPVFPSPTLKRSTGSPKTPHLTTPPKTPFSKEREAPFGAPSYVPTGGTTIKGETGGSVPAEEGEEKKKPVFKTLLSKLRGSKLAPLEV